MVWRRQVTVFAAIVAVAVSGCMRPVKTARTSPAEPLAREELEAREQLANRACHPGLGFLFPGLAQLCLRETGKGAAMIALGAAEAGAAVAVGLATREDESLPPPPPGTDQPRSGFEHPGATIPILAFQQLYVYGIADWQVKKQLAAAQPYAPRDSTADLLAAPFNGEVMKRPSVWLGILGSLAVGIGASLLLDSYDRDLIGTRPNVFGREFPPGAGYPLGLGAQAALFGQVGVSEETLFRGVVQSRLANNYGETGGWLLASGIFGLAHVPNALVLDPEDREEFLLLGIPTITAVGAYFGWAYRHEGYTLAPPVALHFWYDFLLSATFFVLDPKDSLISTRISIPF